MDSIKFLDPIPGPYRMTRPNNKIKLFEGDIVLRYNEYVFPTKAKICFIWTPRVGVFIDCDIYENLDILWGIISHYNIFQLQINGLNAGHCHAHTILSKENYYSLHLVVHNYFLGDKNVEVFRINFSIPNLRDLHQEGSLSDERLLRFKLIDKKYLIEVSYIKDSVVAPQILSQRGGFMLLYNGCLVSKNKPISFAESDRIFNQLGYFLSFINGRKTTILLGNGVHDKSIVWRFARAPDIEPYNENTVSWAPPIFGSGLNQMWNRFTTLCSNDLSLSFLTEVIDWYLECNDSRKLIRGRIVMAQAALEAIFNWVIVKEFKIIRGKDSKNISASNKIRLILHKINASCDIPKSFGFIRRYFNNLEELDGPEAVTRIRNVIVHADDDKKIVFDHINSLFEECLQLSISYLEISLLYFLNYDGQYRSRVSFENSVYGDELSTPLSWPFHK